MKAHQAPNKTVNLESRLKLSLILSETLIRYTMVALKDRRESPTMGEDHTEFSTHKDLEKDFSPKERRGLFAKMGSMKKLFRRNSKSNLMEEMVAEAENNIAQSKMPASQRPGGKAQRRPSGSYDLSSGHYMLEEPIPQDTSAKSSESAPPVKTKKKRRPSLKALLPDLLGTATSKPEEVPEKQVSPPKSSKAARRTSSSGTIETAFSSHGDIKLKRQDASLRLSAPSALMESLGVDFKAEGEGNVIKKKKTKRRMSSGGRLEHLVKAFEENIEEDDPRLFSCRILEQSEELRSSGVPITLEIPSQSSSPAMSSRRKRAERRMSSSFNSVNAETSAALKPERQSDIDGQPDEIPKRKKSLKKQASESSFILDDSEEDYSDKKKKSLESQSSSKSITLDSDHIDSKKKKKERRSSESSKKLDSSSNHSSKKKGKRSGSKKATRRSSKTSSELGESGSDKPKRRLSRRNSGKGTTPTTSEPRMTFTRSNSSLNLTQGGRAKKIDAEIDAPASCGIILDIPGLDAPIQAQQDSTEVSFNTLRAPSGEIIPDFSNSPLRESFNALLPEESTSTTMLREASISLTDVVDGGSHTTLREPSMVIPDENLEGPAILREPSMTLADFEEPDKGGEHDQPRQKDFLQFDPSGRASFSIQKGSDPSMSDKMRSSLERVEAAMVQMGEDPRHEILLKAGQESTRRKKLTRSSSAKVPRNGAIEGSAHRRTSDSVLQSETYAEFARVLKDFQDSTMFDSSMEMSGIDLTAEKRRGGRRPPPKSLMLNAPSKSSLVDGDESVLFASQTNFQAWEV